MKLLYYRLRAIVVPILLRIVSRRQPAVVRGEGCAEQLYRQLPMLGFDRALLVTDEVLHSIGAVDGVKQALTGAGVQFAIYDGVRPDPSFEQVQAGVATGREIGATAVVAVGGGSVLDAAKLMSLLSANDSTLEQFAKPKFGRKAGWPLVAIPTTAGTGSEVTPIAVITDPDTHQKTPVADGAMVPVHVALDAGLMRGMPPGITAATGMDALTHAVESFLSKASDDETERLAVSAVRLIFQHLPRAVANGDDMDSRDAMALAAFYAGSAFSRTSVGYAHAIAHQLGRICGTPHGNANAMVLPEVLEAYGDCVHGRLAELSRRAGFNGQGDDALVAGQFIQHIIDLRRTLDLPLLPRGLEPAHIADIVQEADSEAGNLYPVPRYLAMSEISDIVRGLLPASQPRELEVTAHGH